MALTLTGIALADPAGSRFGIYGIGQIRENFAVLSAWLAVAMAVSGMVIFRVLRDRAGLGLCTVLMVAETVVALAVTLR